MPKQAGNKNSESLLRQTTSGSFIRLYHTHFCGLGQSAILRLPLLAVVGGTSSELFDWQARRLDIYLFYVYGRLQCFDAVGWVAGRASGL